MLLLLGKVFGDRAHDSATDRAQEAMTSLVTQEPTACTTSKRSQQTTIRLSHWRCRRIIVGRIRIRALACSLRVGLRTLLTLLLRALVVHPSLVLCIRIVLATALLLLALIASLTIVVAVALRV
jgi:hypothetical protein